MTTLLESGARPPAGDPVEAAQPLAPRDSAPRWETWWFLYLPFTISVLLTFGRTPDDPLITLRYAANVLDGHGAVFNSGEHVQGFSSPLHLLISVLIVAAPGGAVLLKAKLVSLVFGVLAVREGGKLLRSCALPTWATRLGFALVATSFVMATSSANGLETSLAAWLTVLLVHRLIAGRGVSQPLVTGMIAGALALTRPESAVLLAGLVGTALVLERSVGAVRRAAWVAGGGVALLTAALVSVLYFGDPLPNTYYAKNGALAASVSGGLRYLATSLQPSDLLTVVEAMLFVAGAAVVFACVRRMSYAVVVVLAQVVFVLRSGGDWMIGGRFLAPVIILFIVVQVFGIVEIARRVRTVPATLRLGVVGSLVALATVVGVVPYLHGAVPAWSSNGRVDDGSLIAAGGYGVYSEFWSRLPSLVSCVGPGASVATTEVGNLGYARRDLRVVDLRGLTDDVIARTSPASSKHPWGVSVPDWSAPASVAGRRLLQQQPAVIALRVEEGRYPAVALGGAYRRRAMIDLSTGDRVAVYLRSGTTCGR